MIPLISPYPPVNRDEFVEALTQGLGRVFDLPPRRPLVVVEGENFPSIQHLSLDITDASVKKGIRLRLPGGRRHSGIMALSVQVIGRRVMIERAAVDFEISAQGVQFDINHDQAEHFFDPVDAENGRFQSHIGHADLESLLLDSAQEEVAKHGLTIERVELTLKENDSRSVYAEARVTASTKMAFATVRAVIRGRGQVIIDDSLSLALKGLTFEGEGLAGKMAATLAHKQLQEWDGWSFPLTSLTLGQLRLQDVRIGCRDGLQIEATLGGPEK